MTKTKSFPYLRNSIATRPVLIDGLRSRQRDPDVVPGFGKLRLVSNDELIFQRFDDVVHFEDDLVALVDFHETLAGPSRRSLDGRASGDHLRLSLATRILGLVSGR